MRRSERKTKMKKKEEKGEEEKRWRRRKEKRRKGAWNTLNQKVTNNRLASRFRPSYLGNSFFLTSKEASSTYPPTIRVFCHLYIPWILYLAPRTGNAHEGVAWWPKSQLKPPTPANHRANRFDDVTSAVMAVAPGSRRDRTYDLSFLIPPIPSSPDPQSYQIE